MSKDCLLVCKAIVPESGNKLLESLEFSKEERIDHPPHDLVLLIDRIQKCYIEELKETNYQP